MRQAPRRAAYKNSPIVEALVELRFVPGQEWDPTIPGKLHQHAAIRDEYPGKPRTQNMPQVAGQPASFAMQGGAGRVLLVDGAGKRLISLGPDVLSVNVLGPYEGWEKFRRRIEAALKAYAEIAGRRR